MNRFLTLVFVAVLVCVSNAVYADDAAVVKSEAPIVIGHQEYYGGGFGHHGLHFDHYGMPVQKVSVLTKIGYRIKSAKAAMEARRAARYFGGYGYGYDNGYFVPKHKRFSPRGNYGFGGGFHHGYQGFPAEFQVGGYY